MRGYGAALKDGQVQASPIPHTENTPSDKPLITTKIMGIYEDEEREDDEDHDDNKVEEDDEPYWPGQEEVDR